MEPTIGVRRISGTWTAYFTIGNQSFDVAPIFMEEQNEKSARWQAEMLRSAFGIPRIGDAPDGPDDINYTLDSIEPDGFTR